MDRPVPDSPIAVLEAVAGPLAGRRILDVGCGGGGLAALLAARGADVTGVDPAVAAIAVARAAAPAARFAVAAAEALPARLGLFDLAVMVNALHHVPVARMGDGLAAIRARLQPGGRLVVIEPGVTGSFFEVLRLVEDETDVRNAAQQALAAAVRPGGWRLLQSWTYVRRDGFGSADDFIDRIVAVDPARRAQALAQGTAIARCFARLAKPAADGRAVLEQPILVAVLAPWQSERAGS